MRSRPKNLPRIPASENDLAIGKVISSYAALETIRKLLPKLMAEQRAELMELLAAPSPRAGEKERI